MCVCVSVLNNVVLVCACVCVACVRIRFVRIHVCLGVHKYSVLSGATSNVRVSTDALNSREVTNLLCTEAYLSHVCSRLKADIELAKAKL